MLYKDASRGLDAQLAGSYTGERIVTVSQFVDNDLWQRGFIQMDASPYKTPGQGFILFVKANNLLNTPSEIYIKNTNARNTTVSDQDISLGSTLIRHHYYQQSYLLGVR